MTELSTKSLGIRRRAILGVRPRMQAEKAPLHDLEPQERALPTGRGHVDAQVLDDHVRRDLAELVERLPADALDQDVRGRLADGAAAAAEPGVGHPAALHPERHGDLVPAERIAVRVLHVEGIELAGHARVLVPLQDVFAVEVVHIPTVPSPGPRDGRARSTRARPADAPTTPPTPRRPRPAPGARA